MAYEEKTKTYIVRFTHPCVPRFKGHRSITSVKRQILIVWRFHDYWHCRPDGILAGMRKALIILGPIPSEPAGMDEAARWLETFVPEVRVEFVSATEPFPAPGEP